MSTTTEWGETWSEAAPLPGYSDETLEDVVDACRACDWHRYPSLQFAHDMLTCAFEPLDIPINGLIVGDHESCVAQARQLATEPYQAVKLKVGRNASLAHEIDLVRAVRNLLRPEQRLRLDANRQWSLPRAMEFGREIAGVDIEYVEEPTPSPRDGERLYEHTGLPYALDESLAQALDLNDFPQVAALVLKPTRLGRRVHDYLHQRPELPHVFSACFETGIGISRIAQWAAIYSPQVPAGLDTHRWLAHDLLAEGLTIEHGMLRCVPPWRVCRDHLEELVG